MGRTPQKNLNLFKKLCGARFFELVILMTTIWPGNEEYFVIENYSYRRNIGQTSSGTRGRFSGFGGFERSLGIYLKSSFRLFLYVSTAKFSRFNRNSSIYQSRCRTPMPVDSYRE